jgi:multidrug efflux pump subunit AcrA (membrane-fusion protein)
VLSLTALAALFITVTTLPSADTKSAAKRRGSAAKSAADSTTDASENSASDANGTPTEIVIHRRRIHLRTPDKYQVSMHLDPVRTVRLAAPFDGTVRAILHKPGERIDSGTEVVRMDTTEKQLRLERAKALYKAAQLDDEHATGAAWSKPLAAAHLQAAKADLDLAVYWVEQGGIRAPFSSEVLRVEVSDGQVVRMGDPLVTIGDTASLTVEMPVDRNATRAGQPLEVKVEDRSIPGTVEAILPLASRFESLRDLVPSAASAIVILPNADGRLRPGQTVFSPLIPRDVIADVPNSCIANATDGTQKVQVLRDNVVRDVPIAALAAVGPDRSFISGPFDPMDEVIESASRELADGTVVRASLPALPPQGTAKTASPTRAKTQDADTPAETPTKRAGF